MIRLRNIRTVKRSANKSWIDSNIVKLIKKKRALWRTFKRSSQIDFTAHRTFSNQLTSTIRAAMIAFETRVTESEHIRYQFTD